MTIKYAQFTISIHGLDADPAAIEFLSGWLKAATRGALLGNQRDLFNFRDEYDSDIEVEIVEHAGEPVKGGNMTMLDVLIEKWALVEVDTDDEAEAVARVEAMDAEGSIEFEQAISLDGEGSPSAKMETALRLIATIHMTEGSDEEKLVEVRRIAKRAIPDAVAACHQRRLLKGTRNEGKGLD